MTAKDNAEPAKVRSTHIRAIFLNPYFCVNYVDFFLLLER